MLAAPPTLFAPRILWRVLAHRHPAALPARLAPARAGT